MFEKFFSKGAYLALIIATFPFGLIFGEIGPQMKDFLCGCEYCETVDKGFPLDLASHMIRCHSWRKGMQKTMELMLQSQGNVDEVMHQNQGISDQPKIEIEIRAEQPAIEENFLGENLTNEIDPYSDYTWKETELHGWAYATTNQVNFNTDQWIHLEDLGWVWSIANPKNFTYSYDYGWIYTILYQNTRVLYWYDRRRWMLSKNIASSFVQKK
jgi:hypothetical protein